MVLAWDFQFSLPQSESPSPSYSACLELQLRSRPLSRWVHVTWWSHPAVHTLQGPHLSGPDRLEFPKWTLKLDISWGILATNINIPSSDSYTVLVCTRDTVFVSKHVPAFSQSLKCATDYLKSVLTEYPNSSWFKMWVSPSPLPHPRLWSFETHVFSNKNGQRNRS